MSLTKGQLAELLLKGSGQFGITDKREVMKWVDVIASDFISKAIMDYPLAQLVESAWVKPLKAVIEYDDESGDCFIVLPATMANLPFDAALREISLKKGRFNPIRLLKAGESVLVKKLHLNNTDGLTYYGELIGKKVIFLEMDQDFVGKEIVVKMICTADGYGPEDVIPVAPMTNAILIDRVLKILQVKNQVPDKVTNDGNPNSR